MHLMFNSQHVNVNVGVGGCSQHVNVNVGAGGW